MVRSGRTVWAWIMAAAVAASAGLGMPAWAADNAPKIGVVDIQKILEDAPRMKQYMEDYYALRDQLDKNLNVRSMNLMLDDSQIKELVDLKAKGAAATAADKKRIDELEKTERDRDARFKELQSTKDPTEAQKAELKDLQAMQAKSKETGQALQNDYNGRLDTKMKEFYDKASADIQEAVNKVVEAKGLTLVLVKDAVKFGGTDITDDVITKLERKVQ